VDEFLACLFRGEDLIGRTFKHISNVPNNSIKKDKIEIALEVSIRKLIGFFLALDL
jgi:hypothetical protein